jgi:predicted phosphoribosyltransferase
VPPVFGAVSRYFDSFDQVTDDTVVALLAESGCGNSVAAGDDEG